MYCGGTCLLLLDNDSMDLDTIFETKSISLRTVIVGERARGDFQNRFIFMQFLVYFTLFSTFFTLPAGLFSDNNFQGVVL